MKTSQLTTVISFAVEQKSLSKCAFIYHSMKQIAKLCNDYYYVLMMFHFLILLIFFYNFASWVTTVDTIDRIRLLLPFIAIIIIMYCMEHVTRVYLSQT